MGGLTGPCLIHAVLSAEAAIEIGDRAVIHDAPLDVVVAGSLKAIITLLPDAAFAEAAFAEPDRAASIAIAHHEVLTALAVTADVVPVRLGAACESRVAVTALLDAERDRFTEALTRIAGAAEYAVILTEAQAATPAPAPQVATGRDYLKFRSAATAQRRQQTAQLREAALAAVEVLTGHARDRVFAQPRRNAQADRDKRIMDAALLITRDQVGHFTEAVKVAQAAIGDSGCELRVTGPWPAYSFTEAREAA
jgi:hypothetical protein